MTSTSETSSPPLVPHTDVRVLIHDIRNALSPLLTGMEVLHGRIHDDALLPVLDLMQSQIGLLTEMLDPHSGNAPKLAAVSGETHAAFRVLPGELVPAEASPGTVMVIDDNPNIIAALKMMFEDRDYAVLAATSAEDAVDLATRLKPHLCLCDISLPGMDGFEAASRLQQANQAMRMFSMSGLDDQGDREQSRDAGFRAHFKKPIAFDEMIGVMERGSAKRP